MITESPVVYVSAASTWEIEIKRAIGKLEAPDDLEVALVASQFTDLPMTVAHSIEAARLPRHHDDPFDRMLVAQANTEGLTLVTSDRRLKSYDVNLTCL
jgi:PIN domain nuclease of toxin-antitoxin system